ncbi:MAG: hypothetical protein MUC48_18565 [Leptolyngbya sp. Prado105]|jgi:hypothetical protein|nr:hypothetical protein [Leptolyngbya sp. Prado105]
MKLIQLSSALVLASTLFSGMMPARANDALFGKLADKIQCSTADVGLGNNTQNNIQRNNSSRQNSASNRNSAWGNASNSQSSKKTHSDGGGGSVGFLGISIGGSGSSQGSQESKSSRSNAFGRNNAAQNSSRSSNSSFSDRSSSTVVVGQVKDCDSNNAAAAAIITTVDTNRTAKDIANINADVNKHGIDAQVKINTDNNKTAVELLNAQRRSGQVNNLIEWYTPQR